MRELEDLIKEWRKTMLAHPRLSVEAIDELEDHLRENVSQLVRAGAAETEAFERTVKELGGTATITSEFRKLDSGIWLPMKVVAAVGVLAVLGMVTLLSMNFRAGKLDLLLASHVLLVTLGYTTTFLIGGLGICFVGQRCFADSSPPPRRPLTRVTFILGCVAAALTTAGVFLGMVWAKAAWGRYWAWDAKEVGAFIIVLWQVGFLFGHWLSRTSARGILVSSVVGNIIVALGWFGGNSFGGLHDYAATSYLTLLLAAIIPNVAFFLIGLAPAGWLRLRKVS